MKPVLPFRLLLAIALLPILAVAQTAVPPVGSGTAPDPYRIASLHNLYWLSQHPESWSSHFRQTADIDAAETRNWNEPPAPGVPDTIVEGFSPIGNVTVKFRGVYDAQGYAISNLRIRRPQQDNVGLFGRTGKGGRIYSVRLIGDSVVCRTNCGALVGSFDSGLVHSAHVVDSRVLGQDSVGGLVGRSGWGSRVESSSARGNSVEGRYAVGGVVGGSFDTIVGCRSTGTVTGDVGVGGLVGFLARYCVVRASVSSASVQARTSKAGGAVGISDLGIVRHTLVAGAVSAPSLKGGLVGEDLGAANPTRTDSSYWDRTATGVDGSPGNSPRTSGALTTVQAQTQSSYPGWDFTSTWMIAAGQYPALRDSGLAWQQIDFPQLPILAMGGAAIDPATLATSGLPVAYASSDTSVAKIVNGRILPVGGGTTLITATQRGDARFRAAAPVEQVLLVHHRAASGAGTPADPYRIASVDDLKWLSLYRDAWDKAFVQTTDIDASSLRTWNRGQGFLPVGDTGKPFTGSYNGRGRRIFGLHVAPLQTRNVGMFGILGAGSIIDSLGLANSTVLCDGRGMPRGMSCGGLAGLNQGTILHSGFSGRIQSLSTYGDTIGGLVGRNQGAIRFSYSAGSVRGAASTGGLVGENGRLSVYSPASGYAAEISRCFSSAMVWTRSSTQNLTGGLAGANRGLIRFSYATGKVTGNAMTGGLAGRTSSAHADSASIVSSYATGAVNESQTGPDSYTGGFVGSLYVSSIVGSYVDSVASGSSATCNLLQFSTRCDVVKRPTAAMKNPARLINLGSFDTLWTIRQGQTYPGLRGIDNAPFAFADTLRAGRTFRITSFLRNDYDLEADQSRLVARIDSMSAGVVDNPLYASFPANAREGDTIRVFYRVGELRLSQDLSGVHDTLWGNQAKSIVVLWSHVPNLRDTLLSTREGVPTGVRVFATFEPDQLQWALLPATPSRGSAFIGYYDSLIYIPKTDENGRDSVRVIARNGTGADTGWFRFVIAPVNDAPSFVGGTSRAVYANSGEHRAPAWAKSMRPGPADEASQVLSFRVAADDASLFAVQPAIDAATGDLTFTPAPGKIGQTAMRVRLYDDGGTANGGTDSSTSYFVYLTIKPVDPIAFDLGADVQHTYGDRAFAWRATVRGTERPALSSLDSTVVAVDGDSIRVRGAGTTVLVATAANADTVRRMIRILPKAISIVADACIKEYGAPDPALNYTATGLVGGDALTGALARAAGEDVGTYAISQGTLSGGANYVATFTGARMAITRKALSIAGLQVADKVYDRTTAATTVSVGALTGVLSGDDVALVPGTARFTDASVGPVKPLLLEGFGLSGSDTANYTLTVPTGTTAAITARPLVLAAAAQSKTYGEPDPALTWSVTGLLAGDSLTGALTREAGQDEGSYAITQGTLSAGANYALSYTGAALVIARRPASVTGVSALDKVYDGTPTATLSGGTLSGLIPGDAVSLVLGEARFADASVGGGKSVTVTGTRLAGASAGNYDFSGDPAGLTASITARPLSVAALAQTKAHGTEDPPLTWSVQGLVGSDALSGSLSRAPGEEPGEYAIRQGSLAAGPNYALSFTGALLTIQSGPVALESRPSRLPRSNALSLDLPEAFATQPLGTGAGRLEPGAACAAHDQCLSVDLLLPGPATVRVAIHDRLGVPVIAWSGSLTKSDLRRLGAQADGRVRVPFRWNLRAQNGVAVAPGIYLWQIEARTEDGQELEVVKKTGVK